MQNRKLLFALVAAIASAALSYFGTGLHQSGGCSGWHQFRSSQ